MVKVWFQAIRPFSLTASATPVLLGAAWVFYQGTPADWRLLPLIVLASLAVHAATNLVSDYFDYIKGVDKEDTYGSSRVIVDGLLPAGQVLVGGLILFALTAAIGLLFVMMRGWPILILGVVGIAGGLFYTAAPIGFKYIGLGDLMVFILMGPLMVIGSYLVLTGGYLHSVLWLSLPMGFLVAGILSANNLRDILHDSQAGITTTAGVLGHRLARYEYSGLIVGAYVSAAVMIAVGLLPLLSAIVFITLPLAVKAIQKGLASRPDQPAQIAAMDVQTAQIHLSFGILQIISLLIGGFLR